MIQDIQKLIDNYLVWLRDKTQLREVAGDWVEITTPHLDRHNDFLQLYVKRQGNSIILTDDGFTIEDLTQTGCKLDSPKRQSLLRMALAGFGVQEREGKLEVQATDESFPLRKHSLVQAMLAVNDLFCLATPMVASLFYEDVENWLDVCDIRYTPNVKFTGKSGYDHLFDFVIPKSRKQPERILQTITRPSKDTAEATAFKWIDTKDVRPPESRAYVLINDQEQKVPSGVREALQNYDINAILWSERERAREELAA
jgi:hypothetical protein